MKYIMKYIIVFYFKRAICHLFGCNISWFGNSNMPDDWSPPSYCKRCGACHDIYQIESTDFELILKGCLAWMDQFGFENLWKGF